MLKKIIGVMKWLLPILLLGWVFYPTFIWLTDRWFARDSYFGHGILIPLVSLYWIFRKRNDLVSVEKRSDFWGLVVLIAGIALQLISSILRIYFLSGLSLIVILLGVTQYLFGRKTLRLVLFPLCFLFLMVPLPLLVISETTLKLKFFVTEVSTLILRSIGIEATREGSYIYMPHAFLLVGDPCSGLRSLLAILCLGLIFAYGSGLNTMRQLVLIGSGLPLAILSNVGRVFSLALLSEIYGMDFIQGWIHDASGIFAFVFAILAFLGIRRKLETMPARVPR